MRSYIKIYGPPLMKAIKALEKVAIDMPEVCIMDTSIKYSIPTFQQGFADTDHSSDVELYFAPAEIPEKRCGNIISKSGEELGEYDFFFEWFKKPSAEECRLLIEKIDETLAPLGCRYTMVTK